MAGTPMAEVGEALRDSAVFNLSDAVTMVVDDSEFALELTTQALMGFGIRPRYVCRSAIDAMEKLSVHDVDLLIVDAEMPGMDGYELVRWLRRSGTDGNAFAPVVMTAAHVRRSKVNAARDCGINFLVTKPFSASALLERLIWVARDTRPFLQVGDYFGPDRRFHDIPPPDGIERRADRLRDGGATVSEAETEA